MIHSKSPGIEAPSKIIIRPSFAQADREPDSELYEWLLTNAPLRETGKAYLERRAISEATAIKFKAGQATESSTLLKKALRVWGESRLRRSGVLIDNYSVPRFVFQEASLIFPFFEAGKCIYLQFRRTEDEPKELRWRGLDGIPKPPFNADAIFSTTGEITICEGVTDVLSAAELGRTAVGLLGAGERLPPRLLNEFANRRIKIVGDADRSGNSFARRIASEIAAKGGYATIQFLPPNCKDLNEYLRMSHPRRT